jgi:hypothetical protein
LFVGCFIAGVALYYSKDEKDKTMERFARWRRHRESFDRALWSLTGSAYEGHAAILARVAVAAGELRRRSELEGVQRGQRHRLIGRQFLLSSGPRSSSLKRFASVVPSALAIRSAVPIVTFLSPRSTELT